MIDSQTPMNDFQSALAKTNAIRGYLRSLNNMEKARPQAKEKRLTRYIEIYRSILGWAEKTAYLRKKAGKTDATAGLFNALGDFRTEIIKHVPKKEPVKPRSDPDKILNHLLREYGIRVC